MMKIIFFCININVLFIISHALENVNIFLMNIAHYLICEMHKNS